MFWKWKKTEYLPVSQPAASLKAIQLWYVRWYGRTGDYHQDLVAHMEAFTSEEDANTFAESLRAAFKLLRINGSTRVIVSKA